MLKSLKRKPRVRWTHIALAALGIILISGTVQSVQAASASAYVTAEITTTLAIATTSNLDFGTGSPGDAAVVVPAATAQTGSTRASFSLTGNPSAAYNISLPADGTVTMTVGSGGTNQTIAVNQFTSSPATSGTLSATGQGTLYVGATRAALPTTQVTGNYLGSFTVTVTYQ